MIVALFAINIGVLGVSFTLADAAVSAGLGLGLFGVLSIIDLDQMSWTTRNRILLLLSRTWTSGGVNVDSWITPISWQQSSPPSSSATIQTLSASRQQIMRIDKAYTDEQQLR